MSHLSFISHAYIWGGKKPEKIIPEVLAKPWVKVANYLGRPPILSYASYCLDNWYKIDQSKPICLENIALINNFQPVLGIIYNPTTNEYFHAEKNKGAFCNNRQIKVNSKTNYEVCSLAISSSEMNILKSYNFFNEEQLKAFIADFIKKNDIVLIKGSRGMKMERFI